ncbi:rCG57127 [Rattus norvegicus]|uniref:RCG57127 n=1 Tax=Rattus norvegicus TaxID=10116 RepID=A6JDG4_RAT|nr:rCG57127 [Rattus norvegicus]
MVERESGLLGPISSEFLCVLRHSPLPSSQIINEI